MTASNILTGSELSLADLSRPPEAALWQETDAEASFAQADREGALTTESTRHVLEAIIDIFSISIEHIQQNMDDLQIEISIKDVYYTDLKQQYEEKKEELDDLLPSLSRSPGIGQRELDTLYIQLRKIDKQCSTLYQSFSKNKERRDELQKVLVRLQKMQIKGEIGEAYSSVQARYLLLEQARENLQEARVYTEQKRMQYALLLTCLEKVGFSHPQFVQHHEMVLTALRATDRLTLALAFLRRDLQRMVWLCQDDARI